MFNRHLCVILLCAGMLSGSFEAVAGDNAALVSVSVPTNTQFQPGSMFTQTWTVKNTGTTTWSPGAGGYTLNLVGKDSLGAVPFTANPSTTFYGVFAQIGSGSSVAPGAQATFSMSFIAPESAGSVTDTFQLFNSNGVSFGPQFFVSINVPTNGAPNQYDRSKAVSYANNYDGIMCSDGYFWIDGSTYEYYGVGAPVPTNLIGDDCAHFSSCCIGSQAAQHGGGLNIASRVPPTYGEPGAQRLLYTNLISEGHAIEVYSLSDLMPGDLIGWNWEGDTSTADIDHVTPYLGNGLLASHAASWLDADAESWVVVPPTVWHLVHIVSMSNTLTTLNCPSNSTYWQTVTLSVNVSPAPMNGTVQFYNNGVAMGGPVAAEGGTVYYFTRTLPVGSNNITVSFSGGTGTLASVTTNVALVMVNPAPVNITPNAASKTYGQTMTFGPGSTSFTSSGLQNGDTIGSVTLMDSSNGGVATAPVGSYPITASAATGGTFNTNNYSLTYLTNTLTVTLPPNTTPVNITSATLPNPGAVQMNFTGTAGYIYLIEATTNLTPPVNWTILSTNAADSNGLFNFTDTNASNYTTRFYRTTIAQ